LNIRLFSDLAIILLFAKIVEMPIRRLNLNALPAYVLVGFIISSNMLNLVESLEDLNSIASFILILLMLYTGLTTDYSEFKQHFKSILTLCTFNYLFTFTLIYLYMVNTGFNYFESMFIALLLSNTSMEIVAGLLYRFPDHKIRSIIIGASFIDDLFAVISISLVLNMGFNQSTPSEPLILIAKMMILLSIYFTLIELLKHRIPVFYTFISRNYYTFVSTAVLTTFLSAYISRVIGLSEIVGAYLAGLMLSRGREVHDPLLKTRIVYINFISEFVTFLDAVFLPLFFTYVGLFYSLPSVNVYLLFNILVLAMIGKITPSVLTLYVLTRDVKSAFNSGILLACKGSLEVALLKMGLDSGLISGEVYNTILTVSLLTTIIPSMLYALSIKKVS